MSQIQSEIEKKKVNLGSLDPLLGASDVHSVRTEPAGDVQQQGPSSAHVALGHRSTRRSMRSPMTCE